MVRATARCHPHPDPYPYPYPKHYHPHPYPHPHPKALEGGVIREEALEAASNQGQAAVDAQFLGISQVGLFALAAPT